MGENAQQTIPRPAVALAVHMRSTGDGGGFSRSTMRHRDSLSEHRRRNATDWADRGQDSAYAEYDGNRVAIRPALASDTGAGLAAISALAIFPPPPRPATSHRIKPLIPSWQLD